MTALPIIVGLGMILLVLLVAFRSRKQLGPRPENNWRNVGYPGGVSGAAAPGESAVPQSSDGGGGV